MFAGAAREVVFSNPEVVRRINKQFIPVALKAAMVNNPPPGIEGDLYAEIGRSKAVPQGICTLNSNGKVLTWVLSFDNAASIPKFLDHVVSRYEKAADPQQPVKAERFMKFPSRKLADVEDTGKRLEIPGQHAEHDRCPARPALQKGTLVGRIIGRPLDEKGEPIARTIRQEDYMEARLEIPVAPQEQLAAAVNRAQGKRFHLPDAFARSVITHAFLGQLDVNPLGDVPGSRNNNRRWEFTGQIIDSVDAKTTRIRIEGESAVDGEQDTGRKGRGDGAFWEHRVALSWQGYADVKENRIIQLALIAHGNERLRWGNDRLKFSKEADAAHLMAGHPIDLNCSVRYGLFAEPCAADEVVEGAVSGQRRPGNGPRLDPALRAKMQRLQAGVKRLQRSGGDPSKIVDLMEQFAPLVRQQKFREAEAILDEALKLLK